MVLTRTAHLSRLHLLGPAPEGHIGVIGTGTISLFLVDGWDEGSVFTQFPLPAPVFKHLPDQIIILLQ